MDDQPEDEWARKLRAERDRAAADGGPYALPVACDLRWGFGAPMPTILQWEHEAHVFFYLRGEGDEEIGTIIFRGCVASTFGPPGEDGHALSGSGWEACTPLRVVNSPWTARMCGKSDDVSHFVLPFHDTTFECLATSMEASHLARTMAEAVQAVASRWD